MKKILIIILVLALSVSALSCGKSSQTSIHNRSAIDTTKKEEGTEMKDETKEEEKSSAVLVIEANGIKLYASFEDNSSAKAFAEKLESGPVTVEMHDYGSFEKVGSLPWSLPRNDTQITTKPGDVILYQGSQITVYYDVNNWTFTRLASIENTSKEELLGVFGKSGVTVTFSVERAN